MKCFLHILQPAPQLKTGVFQALNQKDSQNFNASEKTKSRSKSFFQKRHHQNHQEYCVFRTQIPQNKSRYITDILKGGDLNETEYSQTPTSRFYPRKKHSTDFVSKGWCLPLLFQIWYYFPEPRESRIIPYERTCNPSARWYCFPSNVIILETAKKIHLSKCHHLVRRRLFSSTVSTLTAAAFALALAEALPRGVWIAALALALALAFALALESLGANGLRKGKV